MVYLQRSSPRWVYGLDAFSQRYPNPAVRSHSLQVVSSWIGQPSNVRRAPSAAVPFWRCPWLTLNPPSPYTAIDTPQRLELHYFSNPSTGQLAQSAPDTQLHSSSLNSSSELAAHIRAHLQSQQKNSAYFISNEHFWAPKLQPSGADVLCFYVDSVQGIPAPEQIEVVDAGNAYGLPKGVTVLLVPRSFSTSEVASVVQHYQTAGASRPVSSFHQAARLIEGQRAIHLGQTLPMHAFVLPDNSFAQVNIPSYVGRIPLFNRLAERDSLGNEHTPWKQELKNPDEISSWGSASGVGGPVEEGAHVVNTLEDERLIQCALNVPNHMIVRVESNSSAYIQNSVVRQCAELVLGDLIPGELKGYAFLRGKSSVSQPTLCLYVKPAIPNAALQKPIVLDERVLSVPDNLKLCIVFNQ